MGEGVLQPGLPSTHSPSAPERPGLLPSAQDASGVGVGGRLGCPKLSPWKIKYKSSTCPDSGRFLSQDLGQDTSPL